MEESPVVQDTDRDYNLLRCSGEGRERRLVVDVQRRTSRTVGAATPRSTTRTAAASTALATTVTATATATTSRTFKASIDLDEDLLLLLGLSLRGSSLGLEDQSDRDYRATSYGALTLPTK